MAVDYDLVILGGTPEGYAAATQAAQMGARTALVLQGRDGARSPLQQLGTLWTAHSPHYIAALHATPAAGWQWGVEQARLIADTLTQDAAPQLMVQGVDVIAETGRVMGDRPLQVTTPSRRLTTRGILLATGGTPQLPAIPGLGTVPTETPETFLQRETLPQSVALLGSSPLALALAQLLRRWQVPVTLITPKDTLLAQEDPAVSRWIRAQLRAAGVQLELGAAVTAIAPTAEGQYRLTLPQTTLTAATLVVATAPAPDLAGLGLDKEQAGDRPLAVNAYLQTSHPRIYACGAVTGGYDLPAIAQQEARLAVENALFWNRRRIDYRTLPYDLPTHPPMARVGLTEPQARQRYSADVLLVTHYPLYDNPKAHWLESTTGFCKIIAHRNGAVLGVHGVGPEATEWVQTLALLMAQNVPWWQIARQATLPHSLTHLLQQATRQWERDRWQPGRWRRDWAENWCNWRRSREG